MLMIICLVFLGVFSVVALVMYAAGSGHAQEAKQVAASLDSALATEAPEVRERIINLRKTELMSSIPWLNQKLLKVNLAARLHTLLSQANMSWNAGSLLSACGLFFIIPAYLAYLRFASIPIALLVGVALGFAPLGWVLFKRAKRFSKFEETLPEALDLMVSALRAGHSLIAAMGLVSRECPDPVGSEFKSCFEEQNFGLEMSVAFDNLLIRVPLQDLRIVITAITIQKESGGNLGEVLDKTSHVIRQRFRLKRQVGVHTAQGRLTGWILTLMPVVLGVALYTINPVMMSLLWTNPFGVKMLWASASMIVVGGLIIRKIVNMEV